MCQKQLKYNGSKFKLDLSSPLLSGENNIIQWVTQARNLGEILGCDAPSSPPGDDSTSRISHNLFTIDSIQGVLPN